MENDVCCGFVVYGLYDVEVGSLCAHFLESFYQKWVLNFVESFFCICWDDHMVFILQFVNMVYHIDWFAYIEESLHPWDKSHLIMVSDPFNVLLPPTFLSTDLVVSSCDCVFHLLPHAVHAAEPNYRFPGERDWLCQSELDVSSHCPHIPLCPARGTSHIKLLPWLPYLGAFS